MIVTTTFSSQLRAAMRPEDWEAIRLAGPGEVRFSRGFRGIFCATVIVNGNQFHGTSRTAPRKAWDQAMEQAIEAAA